MVIRSANDHPGLLWIGGLVVGVAVIALPAICENQREKLLARCGCCRVNWPLGTEASLLFRHKHVF